MSAALASHFVHDELLPRAPGGVGPGAVLAVLAHVGLLWALTASIQWRTHTPEVFSAELWGAVPEQAAPRPTTPPPPPVAPTPPPPTPLKPQPTPAAVPAPPPPPDRDADIAMEQARRAEAERQQQALQRAKVEAERQRAEAKLKRDTELAKKREDDAKRKREDEAKRKREAESVAQAKAKKAELEKRQRAEAERQALAKTKAEEAQLDKQREENLRRMMGQADRAGPTGTGGTGTAAVSRAPSAAYVGRLIATIKPNIVFTGQVPGNPAAEVEVRAAPGGTIISRRLVKSSGYGDWDEAVLRAIDRTASLPLDADGRVPSGLILVFRRDQ